MPSHNPPAPPPNPSLPFFTIDTLSAILLRPLLSPTVALLPPLILLALRREPLSSPVLLAVCLTLALLLIQGLLALDARLAAGEKRALRWADEVVVVAGGEGGLGKCIAEMLGMRGADVAVVDVLDEDERRQAEWEEKGCRYYRCDVGDREAVRELRRRISRDVCPSFSLFLFGRRGAALSVQMETRTDLDRWASRQSSSTPWPSRPSVPSSAPRPSISSATWPSTSRRGTTACRRSCPPC